MWPCAKRAWAIWAQQTSVHRLFDLQPAAGTSQYFWDQMDAVSGLALEAIEADLTRKVVRDFQLQLDTLFYDTQTFFPIGGAATSAQPSRNVGTQSTSVSLSASSASPCSSRGMGSSHSMPTSTRAIPSMRRGSPPP